MAWFALAGAILGAASKVQEGRNNEAWAGYQADQLRADISAEKGAAQVKAANIRSIGDRQRSSARAALAASGVDVNGEGTPLLIDKGIAGRAEHDAFLTLLGAEDMAKRGEQQAGGLEIQGKRAKQAGYMGAATSLLSAGGRMGQASGWSQ